MSAMSRLTAPIFQAAVLKPIGLFRASTQQVAFVGPLVVFLRYGEQYFDSRLRVGFGVPYVAERKDESAFARAEQTSYSTERTEPFRTG